MSPRVVLTALLALLVSAACLFAASPASIWIDVPFVSETTKDGCGPAVISMVVQYWNNQLGRAGSGRADPKQLQETLPSPSSGGIAASEMENYFRAAGYAVYAFRGDWNELKHHVDAGRPLIVSLRASGPLGPLHYAVVVGIDVDRGFLYVNDPARQKALRISREGFESEWNPTHRWTLLVLPHSGD
jgi:ABC-type bacteriocin/lantibiotic exporter with double-glycine peptidase domain